MLSSLTYRDLVRIIAARHGITNLSAESVEHILWEHTAFPMASPMRIADQVDEFFREGRKVT